MRFLSLRVKHLHRTLALDFVRVFEQFARTLEKLVDLGEHSTARIGQVAFKVRGETVDSTQGNEHRIEEDDAILARMEWPQRFIAGFQVTLQHAIVPRFLL